MGENIKTTSRRIDTIDVLRGFALVGILYAHMIIWYTGAALPAEVYTQYTGIANGVSMGIFGGLVFGKFFSVFSFLFGLSFYLHIVKNRTKSGYFKTYIWRLILLFLTGILHHIIWRGDILTIYAVLGIILLFFRHMPHKLILVISLLLIINLPTHVYDAIIFERSDAAVSLPMEEGAERYYALVKNGSFVSVLKENWNSWPGKIEYQLQSGRLLMTLGYFLLGFYAGSANLFNYIGKNISKFSRWNKFTGRGAFALLLIGLLMYLNNYVTIPEINVVPQYKWLAAFLFDIYNACVTIFYITGITILYRMKFFKPILTPLAAMGRMALTNYLLQTFFGLLLFYNFGLGLFEKTSPAVNILLAAGILYLQLKFSQWWLHQYKQGPVEWAWKILTYFKFSSIKKEEQKVVGLKYFENTRN